MLRTRQLLPQALAVQGPEGEKQIIAVSLGYFSSQARSSPKQIKDFIISLEASFREVDEFMKTVKQELEVIRHPAAGYRAQEVRRIQYRIESQFDSLSTLADKFNPRYYDSRMKRWRHRIQFVLVQDELRGKVAEKDKLMEDLRRIQHRYRYIFMPDLLIVAFIW